MPFMVLFPAPITVTTNQGWVGSRLRLRLRLPEAGLFAKILASRPASASKHSKAVGFGLGFGFLKCCFRWIRLRLRNIVFLRLASVSVSRNFVSGFRGSISVLIKSTSLTNFVSISIDLQAKTRRITRCCLRWRSRGDWGYLGRFLLKVA